MSYYRKSMTDAYREMYPLNKEVELDEAKMSSSQIDRLKKAYEPMRGKKISTDNANKLSAMMNKIGKDKDSLIQLFKADIPFVSQSAATQLISKHGMKGAEINKLREEVEIDEDKPGLWDNIHKKRERGEKMRKKGDPGAPTDAAFKKAQEEVEIDEAMLRGRDYEYDEKEGVVKISKKNFAKVHKDNKGTDKSKPTMMVLTKKGTSLVPVKFTEEVELHELTPDEKKLINQMYDKKGNLTPIGKKVMDHGKKTAGKKEEVEVDEKKKEPVFKGTPTQIKKQMKDWKKKHDKVKIGEEELDEALEQYVVIAGPGDNNQKILDIFKGAGSALKKAKKVRDDWNKKNKSKIKLDKKGKPIAAHMARIAQLASTASVDGVPIKKGDDISWSQFNQRIVKEEVELDEAGIMGKQGVVYSSRQLKDRKKEMMVKPPGREEDVIVIDKKDWLKYKKKGYVQAEETNLPNESSKQFKFAFIGLGHEGPSFEAYEFGTDEYRKYLEDMTPMEGARSDAMKDMKRAGWLKSKDLDKDDTATDDDRKAASKNILVQLKKTFDTEGKSDIVFLDKKKKKVPLDVAKAVLKKYVTFKRSDEKLKFQNKIAKSYKDMLQAIKENAIYDTEDLTILDRIEFKIKEKKNG